MFIILPGPRLLERSTQRDRSGDLVPIQSNPKSIHGDGYTRTVPAVPNELANLSGVTPSTVYSMLDERRKELSINVIKKLCDGLNISLSVFFTAQVFDDLEQEIK